MRLILHWLMFILCSELKISFLDSSNMTSKITVVGVCVGIHSFIFLIYHSPPLWRGGLQPSWRWIYHSSEGGVLCLLLFQPVSKPSTSDVVSQSLLRCGLSVPAQKSHCRLWLKWTEGSFFLRLGQRLPQQLCAKVQPTKAFKTDSMMCGLSGELCHLMLLAVTCLPWTLERDGH